MDGDDDRDQAARILDAALRLGERRSGGWDAVRLHDVARETGLTLADIRRHYGHKDALAEAWFDRAERALVRAGDGAGWLDAPVRERPLRAALAWFDTRAASSCEK